MPRRWFPIFLWYAATVSVLILQTQNATAIAAADPSPSELIPIFAGVAGGKNSQPPVTSGGAGTAGASGATTRGGPVLDPLEFSPDSPRTPSVGAQTPKAAQTPSFEAASNSNTTSTSSSTEGASPPPSHRCTDQHSQMSVENVPGVFCVLGPQICSGSLSDGNCPGVQDGLPLGSYCGLVYTGVYGCRAGPKPAA